MDFDLRQAKQKQHAHNRINSLQAFVAKGVHLNDGKTEVIIPSPEFNRERTRLGRKYGFRFHGGEYPQWHRSTRVDYMNRQWTPEQWLELAEKIETSVVPTC
jgi:hypothetical protein